MTLTRRARGVLSDHDIWREIGARNLVTRLPQDPERQRLSVQPSSYDLHVGYIITAQGDPLREDGKSVRLQPGEMAILGTREILKLPEDITGLIVPRDGPAKSGLLILNAGHVDPGHNSFVTAQVINLGKQEFPITVGCSYFSVIFEYLSTQADNPRSPPPPVEERLAQLSQQATHLTRSLIDVQMEEIEKRLKEAFVQRSRLTQELLSRWWLVATLLFAYTVGVAGIVAAVIAVLERYA